MKYDPEHSRLLFPISQLWSTEWFICWQSLHTRCKHDLGWIFKQNEKWLLSCWKQHGIMFVQLWKQNDSHHVQFCSQWFCQSKRLIKVIFGFIVYKLHWMLHCLMPARSAWIRLSLLPHFTHFISRNKHKCSPLSASAFFYLLNSRVFI